MFHIPRHRSLVARVLFRIGATTVLLVTFVVSVVAGALLHLDNLHVRRFAAAELNSILAPQFKGTIHVDRLGHLSIFGVSGVDATVLAEDGSKVIVARGVSATIAPLALARGALFGKGDLRIEVKTIDVLAVEASLDAEPDGSLKLVHAFDPRTPSPPPKPGARGTDIVLPKVAVQHIWAHGAIPGAPLIDADVDALRAALLSTPDTTKLDVSHLHFLARALPRGLRPRGDVSAHLEIPAAVGAPMSVQAMLAATVGEVPVSADVKMHGDDVDAVLDVPEVTAAAVQASVEDAPVYGTVAVHGEAHGRLQALAVALHAKLGDGSLDVSGDVAAKGALGGHLTLVARDIDARTFSKTAPKTDVGARIVATAETRADQALVAHAAIVIPPGTAAGQSVPRTTLSVDVSRRIEREGAASVLAAHVEGLVDEPGAPLALTADGRYDGSTGAVSLGAKIDAPKLDRVRRVPGLGSGSAKITIVGTARLAGVLSFDTTTRATVDRFARSGISVGHLVVDAHVHGTADKPMFDAHVGGTSVAASSYRFSRVDAEAVGDLERAKVAVAAVGDNTPNVMLTTDVALSGGVHADDIVFEAKRGGADVKATLARLSAGGGIVDAAGLSVRGAGSPLFATVRIEPGHIRAVAQSGGLDLGVIGKLANKDKLHGSLALDVDADVRADWARGKVDVTLKDGGFDKYQGAEGKIELGLDRRHLTGDVHASLKDVATFDLRGLDVHVEGAGPLSGESWRQAWGKVALSVDVDAAKLSEMVPLGTTPLADVGGRITLSGHIARDSGQDMTPEVWLTLRTRGLTAIGQSTRPVRLPGGPLLVGPPLWTLKGIDFGADLIIDGDDSDGELAIRAVDVLGCLASVDVKTAPLPFGEVLAGDGGNLKERLMALPIAVRVDVPRRDLEKLPIILRPGGVTGGVEASISLEGSALDPTLDLTAKSHALRFSAIPETPVDGDVHATYDGKAGKLDVDLHSPDRDLLRAKADVTAKVADLLAGGAPRWSASASAKLGRFPLGAVAALSKQQVSGFVSGDFSLDGLHEHAKAKVNLTLDDLKLGKALFPKGTIEAGIDDNGLVAKARLEDPRGFLDANAKVGLKWGADVAPTPDGSGMQAELTAKHFSLAAAAPFVSGSVSELSGWIDANAKVALAPGKKPSMSGSLSLSDGVIQTPAIGEEFRGIKAKVTLDPDGSVKLADAEAYGVSGKLTLDGAAHLDGTSLKDASVALHIKKGQGIPLDVQGTNLGTAFGDITVKATGAPDGAGPIKVAVDVPKFKLSLPEASLPRSPQGLDAAPHVHVGVYRDPDRFLVLSMDGSPPVLVSTADGAKPTVTDVEDPKHAKAKVAKQSKDSLEVAVKIGDIEIVRGQQADVTVGGEITAKVGETTVVRGEIKVKRGTVNVQSKDFDIQKGTISFVGDDPSNPEVDVTAEWTAPDGTHVFADYVGPVKTGKVTLRSEPARPKDEIVSLILFGTADGSEATPYASQSPSTGVQAGTAVGGLATQGLSKGLDQLTGMNVQAKVDTSDSSNPRPEIEVQIAKALSVIFTVVIVDPPPGTNPDRTYVTLDWRFASRWSLESTVGDEGSTFADMVWRHRY